MSDSYPNVPPPCGHDHGRNEIPPRSYREGAQCKTRSKSCQIDKTVRKGRSDFGCSQIETERNPIHLANLWRPNCSRYEPIARKRHEPQGGRKRKAISLRSQATIENIEAYEKKIEQIRKKNAALTKSLDGQRKELISFLSCPITMEIMKDPVIAADDHTYERIAIQMWLNSKDTSPTTNLPLDNKLLRPNYTIRYLIQNLSLMISVLFQFLSCSTASSSKFSASSE